MKKYKLFPFGAGYEEKQSKDGKSYKSCYLKKAEKDKDGKWASKFLNFFENDIDKAIAILTKLRQSMIKEDIYAEKPSQTVNAEVDDIDSAIPF